MAAVMTSQASLAHCESSQYSKTVRAKSNSYRTAIEMLLQKGFQPSRTVVLSYGTDEESGGEYVRLLTTSDVNQG